MEVLGLQNQLSVHNMYNTCCLRGEAWQWFNHFATKTQPYSSVNTTKPQIDSHKLA